MTPPLRDTIKNASAEISCFTFLIEARALLPLMTSFFVFAGSATAVAIVNA